MSMPLMDGFQLGRVIHCGPELVGIPIAFRPVSRRPEKIEACRRHGQRTRAAHLLASPFTRAEHRARVEAFAEGRAT